MKPCPLCRNNVQIVLQPPPITTYSCRYCSPFAIDERAVPFLNDTWKLSALLRERSIRGRPQPLLILGNDRPQYSGAAPVLQIEELLAEWPATVSARIDRVLCSIVISSEFLGQIVRFPTQDPCLFFAQHNVEAQNTKRFLVDRGWLTSNATDDCRVTDAGWERFDEIERHPTTSDAPVFVAMSFGRNGEPGRVATSVMTEVFHKAIVPAVQRVQWGTPIRSDIAATHEKYLMDQVLGHIRRAPFVIADFTEHRNGCYFELGFAKGLGKVVIPTCRADHFDRAHFDTAQLFHVLWNSYEELEGGLVSKISSFIGDGKRPMK